MFPKFLKKVFAVSMAMCLMQPVVASAKEVASGEQVVGIESGAVGVNAQYEYGRLNISSNSYVEFTSPGKIYATNNSSYLDPGDKCQILQVKGSGNNEQVYVKYPTSRGYVSRWFMRNKIFSVPLTNSYQKYKAKAYIQAYTTNSLRTGYGRVYPNDICLYLQRSGNSCLIAMPLSGSNNYRLCWISAGEFNSKMSAVQVVSVDTKVNEFINKAQYRNGASWGYSKRPMLSSYGSTGCCAYVADLVKYVYGSNAPVNNKWYNSVGSIRAGDVIHTSPNHWIYVISRSGNSLYVAEGNWSSKVRVGWNYTISGNKLKTGSNTYSIQDGYHFR